MYYNDGHNSDSLSLLIVRKRWAIDITIMVTEESNLDRITLIDTLYFCIKVVMIDVGG